MSKTGGSNRSGIGMVSTCDCEKTKFIVVFFFGGGGGNHDSASSLECELASNSWYELVGNI